MSLPLPSLLVGRYQLTRLLGEGGFAETYLATDTVLGRQVAIKVLRQQLAQDPQYVARFDREARIAASINHPNVIDVYDFGQDGALLFLVMEWVDGTTLKELIREQAPLPIPEAQRLIREVLQGLGAIHRAGIIHRDIKPQNVLLDRTGTVKLSDFGISKAAVGTGLEELTRSGEFLGTPTHMAPEQVLGAKTLGPEADLYGVGIMLFELLTGELPFSGDTPLQVALKHLHEPPPAPRTLNAAIPKALEAVVLKALAKEPGARYQSATAMEAALESGRVDLTPPSAEAGGAGVETLAEGTVKQVMKSSSRALHSIPAEPAEWLITLTPRQREVLTLVASGFNDAEIARRLSIQTRTVQGHITALQRIAGVSMRADLKTRAKAAGITPRLQDRDAKPPPPPPPPATEHLITVTAQQRELQSKNRFDEVTLTPRQHEELRLLFVLNWRIAALQRIARVPMRVDLDRRAKPGGITPRREDGATELPPPPPPPATAKAGSWLGKLGLLLFLTLMPVFLIGVFVKVLISGSFSGGLGTAVMGIIFLGLAVVGYLWAIWDVLKGRDDK